ncbi:hypothetical protein AMTRI_Chr12g272900 [Amborella trichopoda]
MFYFSLLMIVLSWNVRGLGETRRKSDIKLLVRKYKPDIVILQETKSDVPNFALIKDIWGHGAVKFESVDAIGASGELWSLWDFLSFHCLSVERRDMFVTIFLQGPTFGNSWGIVNVYSPVILSLKEAFLNDLGDVWLAYDVLICFGGDFNFIRWPDEALLNIAIRCDCLIPLLSDIGSMICPSQGLNFIWSINNANCLVMSKLDRFLMTENWVKAFPLATVKALLGLSSDDIPLLLNTILSNYGRKPFRLELAWLDEMGVADLIKFTWENSISFRSMDF